MDLGARSRSVLVAAPIVVALACFAVAGVASPDLIDPGLPRPALLGAVVTVGALVTALLTATSLRAARRPSRAWAGAAASTPLLTLAVCGVALQWPPAAVWGARAAGVAVLVAGVVAGQRERRRPREWAYLMLDGWLVAASVLLICWVVVGLTGSPLDHSPDTLRVALWWVPVDLVLASVATGLSMRSVHNARASVMLVVLAALLGVVVDITWGLTGAYQYGAIAWIIMALALGGATLVGPLDIWGASGPPESYPPLLRLPQWTVVPGLIAAVADTHDPVVMVTAVSVILGLALELATAGRQNLRLWLALRRQAQRLDQLLAESRDALVHVDGRGVVRFASEALVDVLGLQPQQVVGRRALAFAHRDDRRRLLTELERIDRSGGGADAGRLNGRFRHADGSWRSVEATVSRRTSGEPGYILSARDVTARVTLEAELRRLADTDALTGLANRSAFLALLDERARRGPVTVLFVDLDGFKAVNDMDGHAAGDRLLREVADTLRRELRGHDVAARLGGDEFAVLLHSDQPAEVHAVAERLVHRLRQMPSDPAHRTAASVGVAIGRGDTAGEVLLGDADLAMYEAKARGGRRFVVFEPSMRERVVERARINAGLEQACAGEGLLLDVQPIVSMADGVWVGFEALSRWQDGTHRRQPQEFLPVAEESGLIDTLGRWVLHRSVGWLARWPDRRASIAVNVAGSQLATVGFADWVHQQLAGHGVAPNRLTLEISERTALGDVQRATAALQPLRALGVRISLDDFGTGYSSLGHLAEVPLDELKIDQRFVAGLGRRATDDALVRAVCRLAEDLGLEVVAEGVETAAQEHLLLEHGCRLGQGYRYLEPTSITQLQPPVTPTATGPATGPIPTAALPENRTVAS